MVGAKIFGWLLDVDQAMVFAVVVSGRRKIGVEREGGQDFITSRREKTAGPDPLRRVHLSPSAVNKQRNRYLDAHTRLIKVAGRDI